MLAILRPIHANCLAQIPEIIGRAIMESENDRGRPIYHTDPAGILRRPHQALLCQRKAAVMEELPRNHFGAILADPPWAFKTFSGNRIPTKGEQHYSTMDNNELLALPVSDLAAENSVLFLWFTWPTLQVALQVIEKWGFVYKTCAFSWMKANGLQSRLFDDETSIDRRGMGYWTLSNSEACLLATCGRPKRLNADVHQGIIAPRREHSRKPNGVHERIERLVAGPYLELFARQERQGWTTWGNETQKFGSVA